MRADKMFPNLGKYMRYPFIGTLTGLYYSIFTHQKDCLKQEIVTITYYDIYCHT